MYKICRECAYNSRLNSIYINIETITSFYLTKIRI